MDTAFVLWLFAVSVAASAFGVCLAWRAGFLSSLF
jgi:hypothetical protein